MGVQGRLKDLVGERFGMLMVLSRAQNSPDGKAMWLCSCDCGEGAIVAGTYLRAGSRTSCGRHQTRRQAATAHLPTNLVHGQSGTAEYRAWVSMRSRCNSPTAQAYRHYGGRGIKICDRWDSFEAFLADMGPRPSPAHSLDRIDVNGDYEPDNCRWATNLDQARNTRKARYIEVDGSVVSLAEYAAMKGVSKSTIWHRADREQHGIRFVPPQSPTPIYLTSPYHVHLTGSFVG